MPRTTPLSIGVLASGSGTNLQSIIDACKQGQIPARVAVVISDNRNAYALERARKANIPALVFERGAFADRHAFEGAIVEALQSADVELVCLAGFMRIIGKTILNAFVERILNIHPALLPAFPGLEGQRQAFEYGTKIAGCTVHFVDAKTDHGPIVLQAAVPVLDSDTVDKLAARILREEHALFPEAIRLFAEGALHIEGRRVVIDPQPQPIQDQSL